jgi:hypothetical protein
MKDKEIKKYNAFTCVFLVFLCLAGFIPLLVKIPYMVYAWSHSPLDRPDLVFLVLFLILLLVSLRKIIIRREPGLEWMALLVMLPALLLYGISFVYRINAIGIIAGIVFAWGTFAFSLGWQSAFLAAPAFGTLLMATTSSRYWLTFFFTPLHIDGLHLKLLFTAFCILFLAIQLYRKILIKPGTFCFLAMLLPASLLLINGQSAKNAQHPFQLPLEKLHSGDFIGRAAPVTDLDRQFFAGAVVYKYYFASEKQAISVLNVICIDNIQRIHPASHCLRSSGWEVQQETQQEIRLADKKINLTEIIARSRKQRIMSWVWYSSQYRSVGSFIRFRSLYPSWKDDEIWQEFQITTPIADDDNKTREILDKFVKLLQ